MNTDQLDANQEYRRFCWQFQRDQSADRKVPEQCSACMVKFLGVLNCFRFEGLQLRENGHVRDCANCRYFHRWGGSDSHHSVDKKERQ